MICDMGGKLIPRVLRLDLYMTEPIDMCDITHPYIWHVSNIWEPSHMCYGKYSYVWYYSLIAIYSNIYLTRRVATISHILMCSHTFDTTCCYNVWYTRENSSCVCYVLLDIIQNSWICVASVKLIDVKMSTSCQIYLKLCVVSVKYIWFRNVHVMSNIFDKQNVHVMSNIFDIMCSISKKYLRSKCPRLVKYIRHAKRPSHVKYIWQYVWYQCGIMSNIFDMMWTFFMSNIFDMTWTFRHQIYLTDTTHIVTYIWHDVEVLL